MFINVRDYHGTLYSINIFHVVYLYSELHAGMATLFIVFDDNVKLELVQEDMDTALEYQVEVALTIQEKLRMLYYPPKSAYYK